MRVHDVAQLDRLVSSPLAAEVLDDPTVVVDLRSASAHDLARLPAPGSIPRILVGIGAAHPAVDLAVADEEGAARIVEAATAHPVAATAAVLLLRATELSTPELALISESATYSALQAGPEHRAWLDTRVPRSRRAHDDERVRVERRRGVVSIALARPEARNAVDGAMQQALIDALSSVSDDEVVLLTGDGPVFSAGGDLDEFGTRSDPASAHLLRLRRSPGRALLRVRARTTAVVQGACHGAGVELPAFAGRVVARSDATFTLPEVPLGLVPGAGGTVSIPRRIGRHRTAWMTITGETVDAPTALDWGLVDEVSDETRDDPASVPRTP